MREQAELTDQLVDAGLPVDGLRSDGSIVWQGAPTPAQESAAAAIVAAFVPADADVLSLRRLARAALLAETGVLVQALRGVALAAMDEVNVLRQRDRDRAADVAAATSLADLKTRWAARAALADRTPAQVRAAVADRAGTTDAD